MEPLILIVKWPYLILSGNNYDQRPADKEVTKLRRLRRLRWDRFLGIFDLISSEFSEQILGDVCHMLVFLMIIVISVLFNLLAVTILLIKYSRNKVRGILIKIVKFAPHRAGPERALNLSYRPLVR